MRPGTGQNFTLSNDSGTDDDTGAHTPPPGGLVQTFVVHDQPGCQTKCRFGCRSRPLGHHKGEMWAWTRGPVSERLGAPNNDEMATIWPQAGNDAWEVWMRALWSGRARGDYLSDALALLAGWTREDKQLKRVFLVDNTQHSDLTERVKVCADALHLRAEIRRLDGYTQVKVAAADGVAITEREVTLAARIEDAYRLCLNER
jgi:4a-hydroxytetrahydrobiopterin dehydratase